MKAIADFYLQKLITSPVYFSPNPGKDVNLLFPDFYKKVTSGIAYFNAKYPKVKVVFVETYRSNALQYTHYKNGASGIPKNGMHHYGIAVDCAFNINGKFSYDGDYKHLRTCFTQAGLFLIAKNDEGHVQYIPVSRVEQNKLRESVLIAVKDFQRENGLTSDGVVGPKTIAKAKEVFKV